MPKNVAHCRKRVIPYLYTLRRTIAYAYTLRNAIAYLNTCIPYLNTCITISNTLTRLSALGSISQYIEPTRLVSAANQNRASENTRQPIRIKYYVTRLVSQSESSTEKTHPLRQPIRIVYYVTRVVNQSESSITWPESSRLGWRSLLGSRLDSARYSLF